MLELLLGPIWVGLINQREDLFLKQNFDLTFQIFFWKNYTFYTFFQNLICSAFQININKIHDLFG